MINLYDKYTYIKLSIKSFFGKITNKISRFKSFMIYSIKNNKGITIFLIAFALSVALDDKVFPLLWGTIIYLLTLCREILDTKKENKKIDLVSFDEYTKLDEILDQYVQECFLRDVAPFNLEAIQNEKITNSKAENKLINELKDSLASNMSPSLRRKIELYYGEGRVEYILSIKCLTYVTSIAANSKRAIYNIKPLNIQ